jgi:hypothetical protein
MAGGGRVLTEENHLMTDNTIHIEEEAFKSDPNTKTWTEEISVAGSDLMDTLRRVARDVTVTKITVKNESGRVLFSFPLALGVVGVLILGPWTAAALVAAWLTKVSILIERSVVSEMTASTENAIESVATEAGAEVEKAAKKTRKSAKKAADDLADAIKIDEA